jgi:hypothetical protein
MTPLPKKCTGDDPLVDVINRLIDCIRERTPKAGKAVTIAARNDGLEINAQPQIGGDDSPPTWLA